MRCVMARKVFVDVIVRENKDGRKRPKLLLRYNVIGLPESDEENVSERHINKKNFVKAGAGAVAVGTAIAVAKKVKNKKK